VLRQSVAGILLGAGGFNLYDGIVQHELLGLHQVRTWIASGYVEGDTGMQFVQVPPTPIVLMK